MNFWRTAIGILIGGACGLPIGVFCSLSLYWLGFILTFGQDKLNNTVLILLFVIVFSPILIMPTVGAVVGAKLMKKKELPRVSPSDHNPSHLPKSIGLPE